MPTTHLRIKGYKVSTTDIPTKQISFTNIWVFGTMKDEMSVYIVWCGEYVVPIMKSIDIILKYVINESKTQNKYSVVFVYAYRGFWQPMNTKYSALV